MIEQVFLAVDIGASSGRVLAGIFDGERLTLDEVHRFTNGPVRMGDRQYWDLPQLWSQLQHGLRAAASKYGDKIISLGVDTWGVDYAFLGPGEELLGNPYHYRDTRTQGMFDKAFEVVPRDEIFAETGLQFMELNTLYQLLAAKQSGSPLLDQAESLLLMPDLFHWLLTGEKTNEQTIASTSQLYNPKTQSWSKILLERFGLPQKIFGPIMPPGTRLGPILSRVAKDTDLSGVDVVLPGSHDTASAVLAVPATSSLGGQPNWCYLSSGTWSLMGLEMPEPVINDDVARWNFTNEAGVGGTTRLLKNISGLWLVQECRRIWQEAGTEASWADLARWATDAEPLVALINPDDPRLAAPENMPEAIATLCQETNQPIPRSPGAMIRCALESLALRYRQVLHRLEQLAGNRMETIHIVGGGVQNELLCQLTADACERTVVAGPIEATAIGNIMTQVQTAGGVRNIAEARDVIRRSFNMQTYEPKPDDRWAAAEEKMTKKK